MSSTVAPADSKATLRMLPRTSCSSKSFDPTETVVPERSYSANEAASPEPVAVSEAVSAVVVSDPVVSPAPVVSALSTVAVESSPPQAAPTSISNVTTAR